MVALGIVSDLHTEFWDDDTFGGIGGLVQDHTKDAELILLAGDIGEGAGSIHAARRLFPDKQVLTVAGNHEFYGKTHDETIKQIEDAAAKTPNVTFLNRSAYIGQGFRVLGATLWTDFDLLGTPHLSMLQASTRTFMTRGFVTPYPDFYHILSDKEYVMSDDLLAWHLRDKEWLLQELDKPFDGKTIVMTHHAPVSFSIRPHFERDRISPCFASRLESTFFYKPTDAVVWGHTHHAVDQVHDDIRFISNQVGYMRKVGEYTFAETSNLGTTIVL